MQHWSEKLRFLYDLLTSRSLILPIKKFSLSEGYISRPIPTLSDRQFIVAKSSLTSAEEKAQRELFWYREELLRIVCGRWKEVRLCHSPASVSSSFGLPERWRANRRTVIETTANDFAYVGGLTNRDGEDRHVALPLRCQSHTKGSSGRPVRR